MSMKTLAVGAVARFAKAVFSILVGGRSVWSAQKIGFEIDVVGVSELLT